MVTILWPCLSYHYKCKIGYVASSNTCDSFLNNLLCICFYCSFIEYVHSFAISFNYTVGDPGCMNVTLTFWSHRDGKFYSSARHDKYLMLQGHRAA